LVYLSPMNGAAPFDGLRRLGISGGWELHRSTRRRGDRALDHKLNPVGAGRTPVPLQAVSELVLAGAVRLDPVL